MRSVHSPLRGQPACARRPRRSCSSAKRTPTRSRGGLKRCSRQFEQPWTAVVPAIGNANPTGAVSWAAYLFDYGSWGLDRPAGEMSDPLIYNTAYRRAALLELGDQLASALDPQRGGAVAAVEGAWPSRAFRAERPHPAFERRPFRGRSSARSSVLASFWGCSARARGHGRAARRTCWRHR